MAVGLLDLFWPIAAVGAWALYAPLYGLVTRLRFPASGPRVRVKGARLHVRRRGTAGPPVLLLHGANSNAREFEAVAALLEDSADVIALDRPGYGYSSRPPGAHRLERQAALVADAMEALELGPAVIVAHSLGSAVALRLALEAPEKVAGLVLVAPASHPYPGGTAWHVRLAAAPVLGPLVSWFVAPLIGPLIAGGALKKAFAPAPVPRDYRRRAGLALAFRPGAFRASARDVAAANAAFAAQYFRYHEIEAPAVIVTADRDGVASPLIHARQLARTLPRAELITTPSTGHMPHQLRPEAIAAAVRRLWKMA